jgi:hypothetical protein
VLVMTRPIRDLDMPLTVLRQQIRELVARQKEQRTEASAARWRAFLAPTHTTTDTAEEAS